MKAQIDMAVVIDALILIKHQRKEYRMWELAGMSNLPDGFKFQDINNVIEELENVKVTAGELYPQLMVKA